MAQKLYIQIAIFCIVGRGMVKILSTIAFDCTAKYIHTQLKIGTPQFEFVKTVGDKFTLTLIIGIDIYHKEYKHHHRWSR